MKKLLAGILLLIGTFVALVFTHIPGKIVIKASRVVGTTSGGFDSCLHNQRKWQHWWPGGSISSANDSLYLYDEYSYQLSDLFTDGAEVMVGHKNLVIPSRIQVITKDRDSVTAEWSIVLPTGNNPFTRFIRYLDARELKKNMLIVFDSLCHFAGRTENIYGFPIERTTFTEVNLLAYRFKSTAYPDVDIIYNAINKLKQYAASRGASEKYYPMINSKQIDSSLYETMIAISIDRIIPASGDFFISQMVPMKDRFLATEVTGGQASVEKAHAAIEKYMRDHSLSAPARPFEILVTDRSKETDTAKWKTKIIYPSM